MGSVDFGLLGYRARHLRLKGSVLEKSRDFICANLKKVELISENLGCCVIGYARVLLIFRFVIKISDNLCYQKISS